jgi:hypothetical protein
MEPSFFFGQMLQIFMRISQVSKQDKYALIYQNRCR